MSNLVGEIERFRALDEMGVVGWKRHGSGTFHPGHPESKLTRGIKRFGRHAKQAAESLWARVKRAGRSISPRPPSETHKPTVVKVTKQPSVKVTPKPGPMHIRMSPQRRIDVSKMFKTAAALKKPGLREAIEAFRAIDESFYNPSPLQSSDLPPNVTHRTVRDGRPARSPSAQRHTTKIARSAQVRTGRIGGPKHRLGQGSQLKHEALGVTSVTEAKVGDYVTTVGGDKGYVQSVAKGKLAVKRISGKPSAQDDIFYVDSKNATVNPGGPPL